MKAWQRNLRRGAFERGDVLLVVIDANSSGWHNMDREIRAVIDVTLYPHILIGCPDSDVEVLCAADLRALLRRSP